MGASLMHGEFYINKEIITSSFFVLVSYGSHFKICGINIFHLKILRFRNVSILNIFSFYLTAHLLIEEKLVFLKKSCNLCFDVFCNK